MTYLTLREVREKNADAGSHFFDRDTLRFFSSRVCGPVIGGRFFITTERRGFDDHERAATIRCALNSGNVETVGDFLAFPTADAARRAIRRAVRAGAVTVRFDPYDGDDAAPADSLERYSWRCFIGDYPIGSRTTNANATRIAAEVCESV